MQRKAQLEDIRDAGIADGDHFGPFGCRVRCQREGGGPCVRDAEDCQIQIRVYGHHVRGSIDLSIEDIHVQTATLFDHMGIRDQ